MLRIGSRPAVASGHDFASGTQGVGHQMHRRFNRGRHGVERNLLGGDTLVELLLDAKLQTHGSAILPKPSAEAGAE